MAVSPTARADGRRSAAFARVFHNSLPLDLVVGLLIVVAVPLAIVIVPNTVSVVAGFFPPGVSKVGMLRAHGLALPAMLLTVPGAVLAHRRLHPAPILVVAAALLAGAEAAAGLATAPFSVGVVRVVEGVGSGLLVPATLLAAWHRPLPRRRALLSLWAGMFVTSLLAAQALALWPLDQAATWQVALRPYPLAAGVVLLVCVVHLVLWLSAGDARVAALPPRGQRSRLVPAYALAAGITVLALGVTFDWPPGPVIIAACLSVVALFGLGSLGGFEGAGGRTPAFTMIVLGLVVLPTTAQLTYVELGGLGGPGLRGLWPAFTVAAVGAVVAALVTGRLRETLVPGLTRAGLVAVVAGLCAVRFFVPSDDGTIVIVPFALIAVGGAVALTAAVRAASIGAVLFGLTLCFPAVLTGFLLGAGVQIVRLRAAQAPGDVTAQDLIDGFIGALHTWALLGGLAVAATIALGSVLGRRGAPAAVGDRDGG